MSYRAALVEVTALIMVLAAGVCLMTCSCGGKPKRAEAVEQDIRFALPVGSTLLNVQEYLTANRIESSFDLRSKTVSAVVRYVDGSIWLYERILPFTSISMMH